VALAVGTATELAGATVAESAGEAGVDALGVGVAGISAECELVRLGAATLELAAKDALATAALLDATVSTLLEANGLSTAVLELHAAAIPPSTGNSPGSSADGSLIKRGRVRRDSRITPGYHAG
jgi:hypothetical protein